MRAASGQAALDTLNQVKAREEPVALLLSDQRMPGITGVEFAGEGRGRLFPTPGACCWKENADTEAAIQAINTRAYHYYLNKPWDPPEEKLYPVLSDLLDDWKAGYRGAVRGFARSGNPGGGLGITRSRAPDLQSRSVPVAGRNRRRGNETAAGQEDRGQTFCPW